MRIKPGRYNKLKIIRQTDIGMVLDADEDGEILIPAKYIPRGSEPGDELDVFIYFDSEDRLIATTEKPLVLVGQCAVLTCKAVTKFGAFMDWGLVKDLFVPFREQATEMREGQRYAVTVFTDEISGRIVGSSKINKHLNKTPLPDEEGDEVPLLIAGKTDLGYTAIIHDTHTGIIYHNEVFQPLKIGQRLNGYIGYIRPDGKTDLRLQRAGMAHIGEMADRIYRELKSGNGYIGLTDKSDAEDIYARFGMSKKAWKKAVGTLYKEKLIELTDNGIRLTEKSDPE